MYTTRTFRRTDSGLSDSTRTKARYNSNRRTQRGTGIEGDASRNGKFSEIRDVYNEADIDNLILEKRNKNIGGRWVLTSKSDTVAKARYVEQVCAVS